jgi:signal transduction histidine kinase
MEDQPNHGIPLASAAAWAPNAAPLVKQESKILTLDEGVFGKAVTNRTPEDERPLPPPPVPPAPVIDRMAALRDIARRLRSAPEAEETLQMVIDTACQCTRSDAAMLTLSAPLSRQFVCGTALGAGPYISVPLRAGGPSFGEIVLTRLAEGAEYASEDETFGELVAEYVAKAVATLRSGTVIPQEAQDFIDRVTEELRAPLAGAVSTIGIAAGAEELNGDTRKYLRSAHGDTRRMLHAVDNLMLLAHLRPPQLHEMESIPVGAWLERAVAARREQAEDRGVMVTYRPAPEAHVIQGVPAQLDAVAGQLLSNAIKFTESGGRVDVTAGLAEGMVKVAVRDTGIGFDNVDAARMTECFTRAITADAARIPGMGIGLYLANQIVEHHGGRLWLESRRDEGTLAQITFPIREEGL